MSKHKILSSLQNPGKLILSLADKGFFNWMSDEAFLKVVFFFSFGRKVNLRNPQTFNEKLQWMKLNNRNPEYPMLVDKYEVKHYISEIMGEQYVIPTLGLWNNVDEINLDNLPDQFVLKCTHDSGSIVICRDKKSFDFTRAKEKLNSHLKKNLFWYGREWPYREVKPRIIAEQYFEDNNQQLLDYKVMCFNGEAKCCFVFSDRYSDSGVRLNVYNREWELMPVGREYTTPNPEILKPLHYDLMLQLAEGITKGMPFARVDFYEPKGRLLFGEITFFPNSGFTKFKPQEWDEIFGNWIKLPTN